MGPRRAAGYSLLEVVFASSVFVLMLTMTFLPFRMSSVAARQGQARLDQLGAVRVPMLAMMREVRAGLNAAFLQSNSFKLDDGTVAWHALVFETTDTPSRTVRYAWAPSPGHPYEWRIIKDVQVGGKSLEGFPKTVVPRGVRQFYFQAIPVPNTNLPQDVEGGGSTWDVPLVIVYVLAYADDCPRPFPPPSQSPAGAPIELGFRFTLKNQYGVSVK